MSRVTEVDVELAGALLNKTQYQLTGFGVARAATVGTVKLVASYTGPIMRLRRTLDDAEMDVYPCGYGRYPYAPDYALIDRWSNNVEPAITILYDQEGGGLHYTQPTAINQPSLSKQVTSHGVRPAGIWLYLGEVVGNRKFFIIPTGLAVAKQNYGSALAIHPRQSMAQNVYFELYKSTSTAVLNLYTNLGSGLMTLTSTQSDSSIRPRAMPSTFVQAGASAGTTIYANGTNSLRAGGAADVTDSGGWLGKSLAGDSFAGQFDFYGQTWMGATPTLSVDLTNAVDTFNLAFGFPTSFTKRLVYAGSSLNAGSYATKNNTPLVLMGLDSSWETYCMAVAGRSLATQYANRATNEIPLYDGSKSVNVATMDAPSNDISNSTYADQAAAEAAADTLYTGTTLPFVTALKTAGFRVVVPTMISRTALTTANFKEYARLRYNANLRAGATANGYVTADRCSFAPFDTIPTTAYFHTDLVHPNDAGYLHLTAIDKAAILSSTN